MEIIDMLHKLELFEEERLKQFIKPIYPKIESFSNLLKIQTDTQIGLLRVLNYAVILNGLWKQSNDELDGKTVDESCIAVLKKVTNPTFTNTQNTLFLAHEIVHELTIRLRDVLLGEK